MENIIISSANVHDKVPKEKMPTRLDSATNIIASVKGSRNGIILYNIMPEWNCLTGFYARSGKFTVPDFSIEQKDLTFADLIYIYDREFTKTHIDANGYDLEKRKQVAVDEYSELFGVNNVELGDELSVQYELKFSKSQYVWTLYRIESFALAKVDSIENLLNQKVYKQEIVPFGTDNIINGVEILGNVFELIRDESNINILKKLSIET